VPAITALVPAKKWRRETDMERIPQYLRSGRASEQVARDNADFLALEYLAAVLFCL
jgi:hypothetical protein